MQWQENRMLKETANPYMMEKKEPPPEILRARMQADRRPLSERTEPADMGRKNPSLSR